MPEIFKELKRCIRNEQSVALATVITGPDAGSKLLIWPDGRTLGDLGSKELNEQVTLRTADQLAAQESLRASFESAGEPVEVFIDIYQPPPRLIIIGAVHIAIPLVTFANTLGFHTIVVDPRSAFATRERFPHADELIVKWPSLALEELEIDESTYLTVLSHDEKLDNPALQAALNSPARYIGVLGSWKTHAKRVQSLKDFGISDEQLARIHAPIGISIGAKGAQEIALSIIAEIIAVRHNIVMK